MRGEQRAIRVRAAQDLLAHAVLRPAAVVDDVIGLHRRDHAQLGEAAVVLRAQVLGVLDAEAPVARPVCPCHAIVDRQEDGVGAVTDRVDGDLQSRRVGAADPAAHLSFRVL